MTLDEPLGIVTVVTDEPNCEVAKAEPVGPERVTVRPPVPALTGVPVLVCCCTVIRPRLALLAAAPETAVLVMTSLLMLVFVNA